MRLDHMLDVSLEQLANRCSLPVIWTLRHVSEGGKWQGDSQQRLQILREVCQNCPQDQYIDLEYRIWQEDTTLREGVTQLIDQLRSADRQIKLILSFHDFKRMPADLAKTAALIGQVPQADIVKVVGFARHIRDNLVVFDLLHSAHGPTIALAMGPAGQISRILAGKFGGFLTFASLGDGKESAPGQMTVGELLNMYRVRRIGRATKVFGVIADPVAHSSSPAIHNAALDACTYDGVYLPMLVQGGYERFAEFLDGFLSRQWLDFAGASVTIPHKGNALRFLESQSAHVDLLAQKIGAVNTIVVSEDGQLAGYNTDYQAILDSLAQVGRLDRTRLTGMSVAVLGAGGVCRAVVAALTHCKARVTIYNRTAVKAEVLAGEFGCDWRPWQMRVEMKADVVINGTSIGMWPDCDDSPLPGRCLSAGMVVFDTVYNPVKTKLLQLAEQQQCTCIDGVTMFTTQAAAQFRSFTDLQPPLELMRDVVLKRLTER